MASLQLKFVNLVLVHGQLHLTAVELANAMAEDERPLKRKRRATDVSASSMASEADNEVEVAPDGDALIIVNGIAGIEQR